MEEATDTDYLKLKSYMKQITFFKLTGGGVGAGGDRRKPSQPYLKSMLSMRCFHYRPQRSWGKVMFSQASVILLTGGCLPQCMLGYTPLEQTHHSPWEQTPPPHPPGSRLPPRSRHPPDQTPPPPREQTPSRSDTSTPPPGADTTTPQSMLGDTVNARVVRILLECDLVFLWRSPSQKV